MVTNGETNSELVNRKGIKAILRRIDKYKVCLDKKKHKLLIHTKMRTVLFFLPLIVFKGIRLSKIAPDMISTCPNFFCCVFTVPVWTTKCTCLQFSLLNSLKGEIAKYLKVSWSYGSSVLNRFESHFLFYNRSLLERGCSVGHEQRICDVIKKE